MSVRLPPEQRDFLVHRVLVLLVSRPGRAPQETLEEGLEPVNFQPEHIKFGTAESGSLGLPEVVLLMNLHVGGVRLVEDLIDRLVAVPEASLEPVPRPKAQFTGGLVDWAGTLAAWREGEDDILVTYEVIWKDADALKEAYARFLGEYVGIAEALVMFTTGRHDDGLETMASRVSRLAHTVRQHHQRGIGWSSVLFEEQRKTSHDVAAELLASRCTHDEFVRQYQRQCTIEPRSSLETTVLRDLKRWRSEILRGSPALFYDYGYRVRISGSDAELFALWTLTEFKNVAIQRGRRRVARAAQLLATSAKADLPEDEESLFRQLTASDSPSTADWNIQRSPRSPGCTVRAYTATPTREVFDALVTQTIRDKNPVGLLLCNAESPGDELPPPKEFGDRWIGIVPIIPSEGAMAQNTIRLLRLLEWLEQWRRRVERRA